MTAHAPPPVLAQGRIVRPGELTEQVATRHAQVVKTELDGLEAAIRELPPGEARDRLSYRALRLHNALGRGGQALNDHFQTAQVSPASTGGDKDDPAASQA